MFGYYCGNVGFTLIDAADLLVLGLHASLICCDKNLEQVASNLLAVVDLVNSEVGGEFLHVLFMG